MIHHCHSFAGPEAKYLSNLGFIGTKGIWCNTLNCCQETKQPYQIKPFILKKTKGALQICYFIA